MGRSRVHDAARIRRGSGLFRRKPVDDILDEGDTSLHRSLGLYQLIAYLLNLGIKAAARTETVVVVVKVAVVLLVVIVGFFHIHTANDHPFFPFGVAARPRSSPACCRSRKPPS